MLLVLFLNILIINTINSHAHNYSTQFVKGINITLPK